MFVEETSNKRSGYTPITDAEQRLQDEMVKRIERAADELNAALHEMCNVIVTKPQNDDPYQWRWHFGNAVNAARRAVDDSRWR